MQRARPRRRPQGPGDEVGRRARLRRHRKDLLARPRGDRARQGGDRREGRQDRQRRRGRITAGAFAFLALILVMEGIAWLLNEEVFDGKTWPGFFVEAAVFLLIAARAGLFAYKAGQGRRAADARAGDRGGEADQGDAGRGGQMSAHPEPIPARPSTVGMPGRSAAEIRRDIDAHRQDLGRSVEALRGRGHRADRLAPPDPRAPAGAGDRRCCRRLCDRRHVRAAPPPLSAIPRPTWRHCRRRAGRGRRGRRSPARSLR